MFYLRSDRLTSANCLYRADILYLHRCVRIHRPMTDWYSDYSTGSGSGQISMPLKSRSGRKAVRMTDWCSDYSQGSGSGQISMPLKSRSGRKAVRMPRKSPDWYTDHSQGSGGGQASMPRKSPDWYTDYSGGSGSGQARWTRRMRRGRLAARLRNRCSNRRRV